MPGYEPCAPEAAVCSCRQRLFFLVVSIAPFSINVDISVPLAPKTNLEPSGKYL